MMTDTIRLEAGWKQALAPVLPLLAPIKEQLLAERHAGQRIFPPAALIFNAFDRTPFDQVRVVILGQDPYHRAGQAMGLSFSVPRGVAVPPSLRNIYKELASQYPDYRIPQHGDLSEWAAQGVLLLNTGLTVREGQAGSHSHLGWHAFTDAAISALSAQARPIVFMLWGRHAQSKIPLIDGARHLVLTAPHPSPLAGGGFFGNGHFVRANQFLQEHGEKPIDWQISE